MGNVTLFSIIFSPIISSITTITVLMISKKIDKTNRQKEIYMLRIEKLYNPFYQLCLRGFYPENDSFLDNIKIAGKILDLFTDNIVYMSTKSQKQYKQFYQAFLDYFLSDNDSTPDLSELTKSFNTIGISLQKDYKSLCKKLRLETPIEIF